LLETPTSWLSLYDSLNIAKPDTLGPLSSNSASAANSSEISALEPDGSLRFYWLDYLKHEEKLYFVGKLKDNVSNAWVSCCVTIEGIRCNLFVLSHKQHIEQGEDRDMYDTDVIPTPQEVHTDFELIWKQIGVKSWKGTLSRENTLSVRQTYHEGTVNSLRWCTDSTVCSTLLSTSVVTHIFVEPQISINAESPNIAQIFSTNTKNVFESLVLKRKIMGSCWLQIKNPQIDNKGVSTLLRSYVC
jgi:DNA polymerase alpha subunit A